MESISVKIVVEIIVMIKITKVVNISLEFIHRLQFCNNILCFAASAWASLRSCV